MKKRKRSAHLSIDIAKNADMSDIEMQGEEKQ